MSRLRGAVGESGPKLSGGGPPAQGICRDDGPDLMRRKLSMITSFFARICPPGLIVAIGLFIALSAPLQAQGADPDDLGILVEKLATVPDMQSLMRQCPADIWRTRQSLRQRMLGPRGLWRSEQCRDQIAKCARACTDELNSSACFAAARVLETDQAGRFVLQSRQAFALTCALGRASGCINRAAGLRNSPLASDEFSDRRTPDSLHCLRRSFALACAEGIAWGCAMEGQSLRLGEGGPVDPQEARARFGRACALGAGQTGGDTIPAACRFAKDQLRILRERERKDTPENVGRR